MKLNLEEIRKNLKRTDRSKIAKDLGYSVSMIGYVLRGEKENIEILEECIRTAEENLKREQLLIKRTNKLKKYDPSRSN